ncbi:initiator tRNA phosphoribosyl transferase family protein [Arabidopsis thaliana]|uniref:Initiator tRNA phosphoribosyl transferase family protein n=1 Tax=Arabidopsis thaliana TaxID=3702 RepID=F4II10_ARATH|nr:initiator tRNA phosphoribosyl transferase family protein [Arabidopsis thaliana]AEC09850.1 initiator tRNA phosphoribosyl transferase family protein [Arabidopsis thaliana]|eukprot:NP_001031519.1 initiator tRNA phosphoribosyl transferase family protein [Arabidopsis thaliana]
MGAKSEEPMMTTRDSIYRAARNIKRRDNSLYNALRSIYQDSIFVHEISLLWPKLPLVANLRCGLWYSEKFDATCYFKSTDGHTNNLSFNTSRLNLHLPLLAGEKGGCIIIDSTRKGKRFPDSMSKTIPMWSCVVNRSIFNHWNRLCNIDAGLTSDDDGDNIRKLLDKWDCSLHLPLWVSNTERASIEARLDEWTRELDESGADIASLASCLRKPLRPLWVSQKTVIWLNEVPEHDSWDFTPLILVSASASGELQNRTSSEFSWNYIPGAGDDEESWARGLSPNVFWTHVDDLIHSGPDLCNQKVAEIVENDRVYRAHRGQEAPQVVVKCSKSNGGVNHAKSDEILCLSAQIPKVDEERLVFWLSSTNLAVGASQVACKETSIDCILNCDQNPISVPVSYLEEHLHLPMKGSKFDRFSISRNLPPAVNFAKLKMSSGKKVLVCCQDGKYQYMCLLGHLDVIIQ